MSRKSILIALAATVAVGGLAFMMLDRPGLVRAPESNFVQVPNQPEVSAAFEPSIMSGTPRPSKISPEAEREILADAGDLAGALRDVKLAGERQQIACGEIMTTNSRKFDQFIWLGDASKVVVDDGRGVFAQLAPLCDGKGLP